MGQERTFKFVASDENTRCGRTYIVEVATGHISSAVCEVVQVYFSGHLLAACVQRDVDGSAPVPA